MKERPTNLGRPSPEEQLKNVYDSLADDVMDNAIEVDQETIDRASRIARAALKDARASRKPSNIEQKPPRP